MLLQRGVNGMPKRIEHKIDSLTTSKFCRGDEIGITGNQNNLINLPLETQGCNVQTDTHINALLGGGILKICIGQDCKIKGASKQLLQFSFF